MNGAGGGGLMHRDGWFICDGSVKNRTSGQADGLVTNVNVNHNETSVNDPIPHLKYTYVNYSTDVSDYKCLQIHLQFQFVRYVV